MAADMDNIQFGDKGRVRIKRPGYPLVHDAVLFIRQGERLEVSLSANPRGNSK